MYVLLVDMKYSTVTLSDSVTEVYIAGAIIFFTFNLKST